MENPNETKPQINQSNGMQNNLPGANQKTGGGKLITIAVLLLIVAGLVYFFGFKNSPKPQPAEVKTSTTKIPTKAFSNDQLPTSWPVDIPLEPGAKIAVNYLTNNPDGSVVLVHGFTSAKTIDQNAKIYIDYFASAGFKIVSKLDQPSVKSYTATKDNEQIRVVILQDAQTKIVNINITVTFTKK